MLQYASSSSSSTWVSQGYDVFISFRGEDTRMGFTSHLYEALIQNGIRTYKDDKTLEIGRPIASDLLEAIESSRIAIVVLSKQFATSKWCLEEIAKITECLKQGKLIVIPIFYHVDPSDVRHQINCFKHSFSNHERDLKVTPQKVETWRAAFREVGALSGLHVTQHRDEAEVVNKIMSKILSDLPDKILPIDLYSSLVGIKSRVDEMKRILRMDSSGVLFIGICGMSGIGKTTLAEVVYQETKNKFERSSLIGNIKDISKQNDTTDLCNLQQKLLDDIFGDKIIRVRSVKEGHTLLGTKLRGLKVLIMLDDVNHVDQLTYLAGGSEWFGSGSRIIVTTTNRDLLNLHQINDIYMCEAMNDDEALRLFCQSAFKQNHPAHDYEMLSDGIVKLAGGLPLALNVYGSLLCGKDENYWTEMSKKLEEYSEKEVLGRLEVVYARLDTNQRDIFVYIACFLKGRNKDLVKAILSNIGLYSESGITDLVNTCLITINLDDSVWMHDLLQQMCWEIIRKESRGYDGKHIAIKYRKDIVDILSSKPKGMRTVEIINHEPYKGKVNDFMDPACLSKMTKLKFLRISSVHFPQGLHYLSNDLRILEWYGCSLKSLPSLFEPKHIYELELCSSQHETLWKKDLELPNLGYINLNYSMNLSEIPDLTSASNLVQLKLEGCTKLTRLHESVLRHKKLCYLTLKGCTSLESLGGNLMEMEALEALLLSNCSKLEYIPEFGKNMKRLELMCVDGTRIKKLPENLREMCDLRSLKASETSIEDLPSSIHFIRKLRLLHLSRCPLSFKTGGFFNPGLDRSSSRLREVDLSYCNLSCVPDGIGLLLNLITLNLSGNEFVLLPASIGLLSKLRTLYLDNCKRLRSLPKLSLVDGDFDYEPRSRFYYHVSTSEEVDVSEFHASRDNSSPTVSCLNCPNLAVNKPGSLPAEKIFNSYLQLRTQYWKTPEAVFEIIGAGNVIPSGFVEPGSEGLILEGSWIGVAICATISAHLVDGYMEAKYTVTAHIHLGGKHWTIPVPVNLLLARRQLVFYWTVADDLQRIVGSSQRTIFGVSFSVEPRDSNIHVANVGVHFIRKEYITSLKQRIYNEVTRWLHTKDLVANSYISEGPNQMNPHQQFLKITNFCVDYGIYQITKGVLDINQQFFSHLSIHEGELMGTLFVYDYYVISLGASVLYNDFAQSLKEVNDCWLSVKFALEQIVIRSSADNYTYKEMLQHLNDLESPQSVAFSDNFVRLFLSICSRIHSLLSSIKERELPEVLALTSRTMIACVIFLMAAFYGHPLINMRHDTSLHSLWGNLFEVLNRWDLMGGGLMLRWEWKISNFNENEFLLQELMKKMGRSSSFTKENEEEMMSVIDKLQKNVHNASLTSHDMSSQAHQYSQDLENAKKYIKWFSQLSKDDYIISMLPLFNRS